MAKIYLIYNIKNNKKYVGETTNCVSQRFCQHIDAAFRTGEKKINNFYRDIKSSGENVFNEFKYKILEECSDDVRKEKELEYIQKIKPEYNEVFKHYYLLTQSQKIIDEYNSGMTITQLRKKYKCRHKLIANILNFKRVKIQRSRNEHSKKVYLFDENGKVVKCWNDAGQCSSELKIDRGNIRCCCLKNTTHNILYFTAGGYHFKYSKETPKDMFIVIDENNKEFRFKSKESLINFFKNKYPKKNILYGQIVRKRKKVYGCKITKLYEFRN